MTPVSVCLESSNNCCMKTLLLRIIMKQIGVSAVKGTRVDTLRLGRTAGSDDLIRLKYAGRLKQQG